MVKQVKLTDFLTARQIERCCRIFKYSGDDANQRIQKEVIEPNIKAINQKLGQENDPAYLAYAVVYALMQSTT